MGIIDARYMSDNNQQSLKSPQNTPMLINTAMIYYNAGQTALALNVLEGVRGSKYVEQLIEKIIRLEGEKELLKECEPFDMRLLHLGYFLGVLKLSNTGCNENNLIKFSLR